MTGVVLTHVASVIIRKKHTQVKQLCATIQSTIVKNSSMENIIHTQMIMKSDYITIGNENENIVYFLSINKSNTTKFISLI